MIKPCKAERQCLGEKQEGRLPSELHQDGFSRTEPDAYESMRWQGASAHLVPVRYIPVLVIRIPDYSVISELKRHGDYIDFGKRSLVFIPPDKAFAYTLRQ
jgi:hypothetical protein